MGGYARKKNIFFSPFFCFVSWPPPSWKLACKRPVCAQSWRVPNDWSPTLLLRGPATLALVGGRWKRTVVPSLIRASTITASESHQDQALQIVPFPQAPRLKSMAMYSLEWIAQRQEIDGRSRSWRTWGPASRVRRSSGLSSAATPWFAKGSGVSNPLAFVTALRAA